MAEQAQQKDGFPTTDWELLRSLQTETSTDKQAVLHELINRYWPAMRHYLLTAKRIPADEADEIRSAFTVDRLLSESHLFSRADSSRGKFRTLLIRSLENYLVDRARKMRTSTPLDQDEQTAADASASPAAAFERAWAQSVLSEALQLTEDWLTNTGQADSWEIFKARIVLPATEGAAPVDFAALVEIHSLKSPVQASNLLTSARRVFVRKLASVLSRYLDEGQDFEDQLAELRKIF